MNSLVVRFSPRCIIAVLFLTFGDPNSALHLFLPQVCLNSCACFIWGESSNALEKLFGFGRLDSRAVMPLVDTGTRTNRFWRSRRDGEHSRRVTAARNSDSTPARHQSQPDRGNDQQE